MERQKVDFSCEQRLVDPYLEKLENIQGGHLLVIDGVITLRNGHINGQLG